MKLAKLIHNPTAGDEEHNKKELIALIEQSGFACRYSSTKKTGWDTAEDDVDLLIVAGGDGTVRKTVDVLLQRKLLDKRLPLGVLPMGTANNISKMLGQGNLTQQELLAAWQTNHRKGVDIGRLMGVRETGFFLESFGYGIFPKLMREMAKLEEDASRTPEQEMQLALEKMHEIILSSDACYCELVIDGADQSGRYLMVEVMNTPSMGANLVLAPAADPGDGILEIVMVPESRREELAAYLQKRIAGEDVVFEYITIHGKEISICWQKGLCHADDKLMKLEKGNRVEISVLPRVIDFLSV